MRKTKIRYGRVFGAVIFLLLLATGIFYGGLFLFSFASRWKPTGEAEPVSYCLFMGIRDSSARQADSLVLTALDRKNQSLYAVSLPGNTKISKDENELLLLKDVYADGGAERTVSAVENLLHIRIGNYAVFDEAVFSALLDRYGGMDFYIERDMYHEDEMREPDIQLRQGVQEIDGKSVVQYMRYIDAEDGEIGRLQREERLLKALWQEKRGDFRLPLWWMIRSHWELPDTNLTADEAASAFYDILGFPEENVHFIILPGEEKKINDRPAWQVNPVEVQKVVGLMLGGETSKENHT